MDPATLFQQECLKEIELLGKDRPLRKLTRSWFDAANALKYSYHFRALGRPIIQYPQDIVALEEIIWRVRPTLIIETGVAHGGSLVLSAAGLALLDYTDAVQASKALNVRESRRRVIGIDIDIRAHNRVAIESHPLGHKIELLQGSSTDRSIADQVYDRVADDDRVLVILDSNHTHEHVLAELRLYAPLVSAGSYCIVFDTVIEDLPPDSFGDRPWNVGNSPKTAVQAFLTSCSGEGLTSREGRPLSFEVDREIEDKLLITVAPHGFLKRVELAE